VPGFKSAIEKIQIPSVREGTYRGFAALFAEKLHFSDNRHNFASGTGRPSDHMLLSSIDLYLNQIESALKQGDSTEHTHRPFLKALIESFRDDITATNEPKRKGGNAPDFVVLESKVPIGYLEAKDVGKPLSRVAE
jgi:hypothetical protein